jgi:hypothetical protein
VQSTLSDSNQVGLFPCRGPVVPCRTLLVVFAICEGIVKQAFARLAVAEGEVGERPGDERSRICIVSRGRIRRSLAERRYCRQSLERTRPRSVRFGRNGVIPTRLGLARRNLRAATAPRIPGTPRRPNPHFPALPTTIDRRLPPEFFASFFVTTFRGLVLEGDKGKRSAQPVIIFSPSDSNGIISGALPCRSPIGCARLAKR